MITPYDRGALPMIEKAIQKSDLGLTPANDGGVIRLAIPPLTEERRKELAKHVRKRAEEARVAVRNIRRDIHEHLRKIEHDHNISQDDLKRSETELQKRLTAGERD
jgi:ribosome recycling factor